MSKRFEIKFAPLIAEILNQNNISIAISTYQAGRVIFIGSKDGITLTQIPVSFKKPMGISILDNKLAVASMDSIRFFADDPKILKTAKLNDQGFDRAFLERAKYHTGTNDIHDIHFGKGQIWGVNTLFSCICTFDINYSFVPKWKPPFISDLLPEDRCHLNGMVVEDGLPSFTTALSAGNHKNSWKENILESGILMSVPEGEILSDHLCIPHSPIKHENKIYLLESGLGNLVEYDIENKSTKILYCFERFTRGMAIHNGMLFIAVSKVRKSSKTFSKLSFTEKDYPAGIIIYSLNFNEVLGEIEYHETVEEIYDLKIIPNANKAVAMNEMQEIQNQVITFPGSVFWKKPESNKK